MVLIAAIKDNSAKYNNNTKQDKIKPMSMPFSICNAPLSQTKWYYCCYKGQKDNSSKHNSNAKPDMSTPPPYVMHRYIKLKNHFPVTPHAIPKTNEKNDTNNTPKFGAPPSDIPVYMSSSALTQSSKIGSRPARPHQHHAGS